MEQNKGPHNVVANAFNGTWYLHCTQCGAVPPAGGFTEGCLLNPEGLFKSVPVFIPAFITSFPTSY